MTTPPFVLFVCLHGSAKSVIASQYFRRLAAERGLAADTGSAGTEPDAEIPPGVARGLRGVQFAREKLGGVTWTLGEGKDREAGGGDEPKSSS